jgi:hypothetical protein
LVADEIDIKLHDGPLLAWGEICTFGANVQVLGRIGPAGAFGESIFDKDERAGVMSRPFQDIRR